MRYKDYKVLYKDDPLAASTPRGSSAHPSLSRGTRRLLLASMAESRSMPLEGEALRSASSPPAQLGGAQRTAPPAKPTSAALGSTTATGAVLRAGPRMTV